MFPAAVAWPAAATTSSNVIDVFAVRGSGDAAGNIYQAHYDQNANGWTDWPPLPVGHSFNAAPAVTSWDPNEFDVFDRATDGLLYQSTWNGAGWSEWKPITTFKLANAPGAVSWGVGRYDLFVIG